MAFCLIFVSSSKKSMIQFGCIFILSIFGGFCICAVKFWPWLKLKFWENFKFLDFFPMKIMNFIQKLTHSIEIGETNFHFSGYFLVFSNLILFIELTNKKFAFWWENKTNYMSIKNVFANWAILTEFWKVVEQVNKDNDQIEPPNVQNNKTHFSQFQNFLQSPPLQILSDRHSKKWIHSCLNCGARTSWTYHLIKIMFKRRSHCQNRQT